MPISRHASGSQSPPLSTLIVLEREQAEVAAAATTGVSTPMSSSPPSNVGGPVARRDGQVTQVEDCMLRIGQWSPVTCNSIRVSLHLE